MPGIPRAGHSLWIEFDDKGLATGNPFSREDQKVFRGVLNCAQLSILARFGWMLDKYCYRVRLLDLIFEQHPEIVGVLPDLTVEDKQTQEVVTDGSPR
jgi:hypothetical protein